MRQSLIELSRREQEISKVAESLRTKAEALTRRAARKKGDERLVAKSVKHRERSAEIALQLEQHKIKVAEVRLKISVMEHALEVVDQRKKVLTEAIQRKDPLGSSRQFLRMHSARSRVGNIKSLSSMDDVSKRAVVVISELELQVAQKEAQAYGKISANGTTNTVAKRIEKYEKQIRQREIRAYERPPKPQNELSVADQKRIEQVASAIDKAAKWLNTAVRKVGTLAAVSDPSVEHAYQRLCEQLLTARNSAEHSLQAEVELDSRIKRLEERNGAFKSKASEIGSQANQDALKCMETAIATCETERAELIVALRDHRKRNVFIDQELFQIGYIVRQLYVLKLLLLALPSRVTEDSKTYAQLATDMFHYLKEAWQQETNSQSTGPYDFAESLARLESRVQMSYLRFAKGEALHLSKQAITNFQANIAVISKILELELKEEAITCDKWDTLAKQALEEEKQLLHTVASQRAEACCVVFKTLKRSLEVLSVTDTIAPTRADKMPTNSTEQPQ